MTRRTVLLAPLATLAGCVRAGAAAIDAGTSGTMTLAIHQNTSAKAGYRRSLEGWARAGITHVELTPGVLDEFLRTDSLPAAKRVLTDLGLTPVSCSCGMGVWEPNPNRAAALESLKKRCGILAALGLPRTYAITQTTQKFTLDDYKVGVENMREVAEIVKQFGMVAMAEFVRTSTFISTLPTMLKMMREAGHPNLHPMLDCYHFWSGLNKLEDLDLIRPGEIAHVHFQDVPDMPRELLDNSTRVIPGDGVTPLVRILAKLAEKQYAGSLSVELFAPRFQDADPFELAVEIRRKAEGVMRQAGVL
jgi:4-hydroxyphenylpyruvate dioxygenase